MFDLMARRRLFNFATAALCGALLSSHALNASAQSVEEIKKKGTVTIGVLVDFPPYGTVDNSNQPDGYDADVAKLLAKDWGVRLNLVPVTGPNRIPFLLTNKVDLLIASFAPTPERAKQVQFSRPHSAATIVLYGHKKLSIKTPADLKGVRIAVARASTQDTALTAVAPEGAEIRRFDDDASAMQALLSGQVDALGCATTIAQRIDQRTNGEYENKLVLRQQYMAPAMRLGRPELLKGVNTFVGKYVDNGGLNKLYKKWLQVDLPSMPATSLPLSN
ncbi:transporter substrate-binding domain-containing protein [Verminephrobacter eiseniae]|uniref:Extracellular solute-binding protein, family 3 n=1 Tax=Verminephrobacter eiseniae (strain EF01-2) TaxID=391735 RepID=A1WN56_VEREI|nr:transporter substrate-binding domain-containing protein [Verminephrobacter eiseniae]ABM59063.1 extracellular solute-binding protein, family 3 [Verminephrobacter eiseniae EF01-2]